MESPKWNERRIKKKLERRHNEKKSVASVAVSVYHLFECMSRNIIVFSTSTSLTNSRRVTSLVDFMTTIFWRMRKYKVIKCSLDGDYVICGEKKNPNGWQTEANKSEKRSSWWFMSRNIHAHCSHTFTGGVFAFVHDSILSILFMWNQHSHSHWHTLCSKLLLAYSIPTLLHL